MAVPKDQLDDVIAAACRKHTVPYVDHHSLTRTMIRTAMEAWAKLRVDEALGEGIDIDNMSAAEMAAFSRGAKTAVMDLIANYDKCTKPADWREFRKLMGDLAGEEA